MAQEKSGKSIYNVLESAKYYIPDYQRGYKWTISEVRKLLMDVDGFQLDRQNPDDYYCLQNITLKDHGEREYSVIDGQQRLTTSIVIISFFRHDLKSDELKVPELSGRLKYGLRAETDKFLQEEVVSGKIWDGVADEILDRPVWHERMVGEKCAKELHDLFEKNLSQWELAGEKGRNHQDIFHLYCAAMQVAAYFHKNPEGKSTFPHKYLHQVRFIENKLPSELDEAAVFSKINGFRVPLDGTDLLRGIFVTNVARERLQGPRDDAEEQVLLNEYRTKAGLELDLMTAWWCDENHKGYFKFFDTIGDPDDIFNADKYPINHLYRLYELSQGKEEILLEHFETEPPDGGWHSLFEKIKRFHRIMQDWYEDREIYHYAGYLIITAEEKFAEVFQMWADARSRNDFIRGLKTRISEKLWKEEWLEVWKGRVLHTGDGKTFNWYEKNKNVRQILILLDVMAHTRRADEKEVDNIIAEHMSPQFFVVDGTVDEKEHVFPQTPIGDEDLRCDLAELKEKVGNYWNLIVDCVKEQRGTHDDESGELAKDIEKQWEEYWQKGEDPAFASKPAFPITEISEEGKKDLMKDKDYRNYVKERINGFVEKMCKIDINSIGNIVLLRASTNRSYGNDYYADKRRRVLSDFNENKLIRIHTRSVFAKEFSLKDGTEVEGFDAWGQKSIEANRQAIAKQISEFVEGETDAK